MTTGVLRYTVVVRNPETLSAVALKAGEPVPSWAKDLIHAEDLGDAGGDAADDEGLVEDYSAKEWTKKALEAAVAERNADRDDDDLIEVAEPGNKPELIAALMADDAAQAEPTE